MNIIAGTPACKKRKFPSVQRESGSVLKNKD
jgi:hypothetical protein